MEVIVVVEITVVVHAGETAVVIETAEGAAAGIISAARDQPDHGGPWAVLAPQVQWAQSVLLVRPVLWG